MKNFWKEFKAFISRGNIVDLAVAVIIGGAFSAIVTALTNKIIMPLVNWILAVCGGAEGLESAYTILSPGYTDGVLDLTKSIYIDWGAFIAAILNFLIIAFTIFTMLKIMMSAQGLIKKGVSDLPTRAERKELKKEGVNMKDPKAVLKATKELRERNKPEPVPPKPTQEELLSEILAELKSQNAKPVEEPIVEEKPKSKKTKKS